MSSYNNSYKRRRRYSSYRNPFSYTSTQSNPVYPRPEVKFSDTVQGSIAAGIAIPSTGIVPICLNDIGFTATPVGRIGAQICCKSVFYNLVFNFGTGTAPIAIRHVLVWDRQSNGQTPAVGYYSDIFSFPTQMITSPLNLGNRQRFVVLVDERITLSPQGDNIRYVTGFRKINQTTTYQDTGVNNFPFTGSLIYLMASDEPTGTTIPTYYGTYRLRYLDC